MYAVRISTAAFGTLCSLTGILAGVFLIFQGNAPTNAMKISYIGTEYLMWEHDTYTAYTLIPNYLFSGIVTILASIVLLYWSIFHIHKTYGSIGFLALSTVQLLTGGGFVIDLAVITFLLSFGINSKLIWWRDKLQNKFGYYLALFWFPAALVFSGLSVVLLAVTVAGTNSLDLMNLMAVLATVMFLPILLLIFGGLAYDVQKNTRPD
jgi:hypothetical protein